MSRYRCGAGTITVMIQIWWRPRFRSKAWTLGRQGRYDTIRKHGETALEGMRVIRVSDVCRQLLQDALGVRLYNINITKITI